MDWPELPGISVDVGLLLRRLGPEALAQALKAATDADDGHRPGAVAQLRLQARGISVDIDVPELVRSLNPTQLIDAVRAAVEPWPLGKRQFVQDELARFAACAGRAAVGSSTPGAAATATGGDSLRLPQIGSAGRPPRLPGTGRGGRSGTMGERSVTWAALPRVTPAAGSTAAVPAHDRGDVALMSEQLRRAIRAKDLPKVETLIASHADLEAVGSDGATPVALAMVQGTPHGILRVLLEAKADVHKRDGQGRSLTHLWSWTLPKSRAGLREEQKKLALLVRFAADLNARLPVNGDTPLHVLARVFNALSARAADGPDPSCNLDLGDAHEAEKFAQGTQFRIQLLVGSRAEVTARNNASRKPLDLVERRFWPALVQLAGTQGGNADSKGRRVRLDAGRAADSPDGSEVSQA